MERRLVIAGGGTGGHLFPGMAVAEEFLRRDPAHRVLFIGTERGIEARLLPKAGYDFAAIRSSGIAGVGIGGKLKGLALIPAGLFDAMRIVRRFKPGAALGVGGYVSGPAVLAAKLLGVPAAIHEQNAAPGFANRILGRLVDRVFISFEPARPWFSRADQKGRLSVTGNPVRRAIVEAMREARAKRGERSGEKIRLLVTGGSQGARALNAVVPAAAGLLAGNVKRTLSVLHQTGEREREAVEKLYREAGVDADVTAFITDMASAYADADIIVSRSGAGSVAEIALAGLPAVLVPFPFAASDHQALNARALADAGAAVVSREPELTAEKLAETLAALISDPARRREMADKSAEAARPAAAREIVDGLLALMPDEAEVKP